MYVALFLLCMALGQLDKGSICGTDTVYAFIYNALSWSTIVTGNFQKYDTDITIRVYLLFQGEILVK